MEQLWMIDKTRKLGEEDKRISSILMYGSFVKGEGDKYSDIEFYVFYNEDFSHEEWVNRICKTLFFFTNEFGTEVAIFDNLIRGEFHFLPVEEVNIIKSWEGFASFEYYEKMKLVDKNGKLAQAIASIDKNRPVHTSQKSIDWICQSLLNNILMVKGLIERGEFTHAQQAFQYIQKYILYLIRIEVGADNHWESPTKQIEQEISKEWYDIYKNCVPTLDETSLRKSLSYCLDTLNTKFKHIAIREDIKDVLMKIK